MANKKKIYIFLLILFICPISLFVKDKLSSKEDIYVLTDQNNTLEDNQSSNEEIEELKKEDNIDNKEITVYISGEVKKAGIVILKSGDRLATAVEKLGGTTNKADLNKVNLAMKVEDEQHYIIPKIGEEVSEESVEVTNKEVSSPESSKININTATIEELDTLPGVGEATANKIVNHRSENGEFKTVEEIKNVNGIGDKKFENIKELICTK